MEQTKNYILTKDEVLTIKTALLEYLRNLEEDIDEDEPNKFQAHLISVVKDLYSRF